MGNGRRQVGGFGVGVARVGREVAGGVSWCRVGQVVTGEGKLWQLTTSGDR